ncbi:MAG: hypothetical protein JSU63_16450 [Phycisphaerales bacterium]|nr:MAG: hypothetical protein JSU63_16450 [Phycisphaerales bacterium]
MSEARCSLGLTGILCAFAGGPGGSMAVGPIDWQDGPECASNGGTGPDVIVGDLPRVRRFGQSGDIIAFAVGTHPCNVGSERVSWFPLSNEHPLILQGVYRLRENRFEQIGMS